MYIREVQIKTSFMKKQFLLFALSLFLFNYGFAQISYVDFGAGLVIQQDENYEMDINGDGHVDFFINQYPDELSMTAIFGAGCIASDYEGATTEWGGYEMSILEEGDILSINEENLFDYIDDGRGSIHNKDHNFAEGWSDGEVRYLGFAVLYESEAMNGWMRVKTDVDNYSLIILDYAYDAFHSIGEGSIVVGDKGLVRVHDLNDVLHAVNISPNPASSFVVLDFEYTGNEELTVSISDTNGKVISNLQVNGRSQLRFDIQDWSEGIYLVHFKTAKGVHTEKIMLRN